MVHYLETKIAEAKHAPIDQRHGMTVEGYTKRSGAPSSAMIRLDGEKRWRRLMIYQISNAGSIFVNVKGQRLYVREHELPEIK